MTLLACIPVTGCLTLAEVAACSLNAADNTYQLDTAVNVVFEDDGGNDILTIYEANRGVQAHAHAAIGALAAINGGSLSPVAEAVILDIEETFTGTVAFNAGQMIYLKANGDTNGAFVIGLDVLVSDENGTAENFSPYGLQFTINSYNNGAYGYGFIGTFQTQAGSADTAYGGYVSFYSNGGSTNYAAAMALEPAIFGGTVNELYGLVVYDVTGATTNYAIQTGLGHVEFGDYLTVNQNSETGAEPTLWLKQADLSEEFIRFETTVGAGNPIDTAALGAYYGKARVYVEGIGAKWIALYD